MVINFNSALVQSSLTGGFVSGSKTNTGQSILGGSTGQGVESGLSTRNILNRIQDIQDTNLVGSTGFQFNNVQVPLMNLQTNQIALGQSSIDASRAINEQIAIREAQRQADLGFSSQIQDQLNAHV